MYCRVWTGRGVVSYPGGMVGKEDTSPQETALREAQEELGLDVNDVCLMIF